MQTDFTCLDYNPYPEEYMFPSKSFYERTGGVPHPLLYRGYILDVFGAGNELIIKKYNELWLKEDIFYPNKELFYFADNIKEKTHRIFAIQCQLINTAQETHATRDVLILLFTMENSNFFYDVLLRNQIKINYLTHINDGGASLGGSKTKMDFIYLYTETLGLTNIVTDIPLCEKKWCIDDWSRKTYHNFKTNTKPIFDKKPEIDYNNWKELEIYFPESKGIYIKSKWDTGNHNWNYDYF